MEHAISSFCDWLAQTPISMIIQSVSWIIPMVQSIHIMAVTIVVGSVLAVDMKLLGVVGRGSPVSAATRRYLPWIWAALVVLLLTVDSDHGRAPARADQHCVPLEDGSDPDRVRGDRRVPDDGEPQCLGLG